MRGKFGIILIVAAIYALGAWLAYQFGTATAITGGVILCVLLLGIGLTGGDKPKAA